MTVSQNKIVTPQSIKTANAVCTAAKTTRDDNANAVELLTAGADGAVLYGLTAMPRATVTATQLQLYRSRDGGATLQLIRCAAMAAVTMSNTSSFSPTDFGFSEGSPLRLSANEKLYVGAAVALAGGIVFDAQYEDL